MVSRLASGVNRAKIAMIRRRRAAARETRRARRPWDALGMIDVKPSGRESRTAREGADAARVAVPRDCTQASSLRRLLQDVREASQRGAHDVVLDMTGVARLNARLLATVLLLAREVRRAGGALRIEGDTAEFRRWAATFNVLGPLERGGVLAPSGSAV
jgi:hypothetical protein